MKGHETMNYMPLNGPGPIRAVERALAGAGFARAGSVVPLIRQAVEPTRPEQTETRAVSAKAPGDTAARDLAVDPSQGHGVRRRPNPDPLVAALRQLPTMTGCF